MENENEDVSKKLKREMECLDKNKRENGTFGQKERGTWKVWDK